MKKIAFLSIIYFLFWGNLLLAQTITIVSDPTWQGETPPQIGWNLPTFNATTWPFVSCPNPSNSIPVVVGSQSMWKATGVVLSQDTALLRKTFTVPVGDSYTGSITINADNEYSLYFNGTLLGGHNDWSLGPYTYQIDPLLNGCVDNVIGIEAINWGGPYGTSLSATLTVVNPLATPVAQNAQNIQCTSFNAVWGAVLTATDYLLDVSDDPTFATFLPGYQNLNVGNVTSYTINAPAGIVYYYRLRAERNALVSCYSNVITVNPIIYNLSLNANICQGQVYQLPDGVLTNVSGTYIDTLSTVNGCDSIITTVLLSATSLLQTSNDTAICLGGNVQLNATGGGTYIWSPAATLSNPNIANPIATPTQTTTYTVTTEITLGNMIANGDFEQGNIGFTSNYTNNISVYNEGTYYVSPNPQLNHPNFSACTDHTTGTGNMMVVNGAGTPNNIVWQQNISVNPNTNYNFSAWVENVVNDPNVASLQFSINGVLLGAAFQTPVAPCVWAQFSTLWNSAANTNALIAIINQNTQTGGNDFAIDDISFSPICSTSDTVQVVVNPTYNVSNPITICQGQTYTLPDGNVVGTTGSYPVLLQTVAGCDSLVTTALTVNPNYAFVVNPVICQNQNYTFPDGTVDDSAGIFIFHLTSVNGCDSMITVNLTVNLTYLHLINVDICQGQTHTLPDGNVVNATGIYSVMLNSINGCDSLVVTTLTVNPTFPTNKYITICQGQTHTLENGVVVNTTGVYPVFYNSVNGCDSTITTHLTVNPAPTITTNPVICEGQSVQVGTNVYNVSGSYTNAFTTVLGCDSFVVTNLTVNPRSYFSQNIDICSGQNYSLNGHVYTQNGTYKDTLVNVNGCDSVITTNINVIPFPNVNLGPDLGICVGNAHWFYAPEGGTSYLWQDGSTNKRFLADSVGLYWVEVTNGGLCTERDSALITTLYSKPSGFMPESMEICPETNLVISAEREFPAYLWSNGDSTFFTTITEPGTYWLQVANEYGCRGKEYVSINPCPHALYIPNAFTPNNNDNSNNYFEVFGVELRTLDILIFDRWGKIAYHIQSPQDKWDGKIAGKDAPEGVYTYRLRATFTNGDALQRAGTITLMR